MNKKPFEKFPELETERLFLKEITKDDAYIVFEGNNNAKRLQYISRDPFTKIEEAEKKVNDYKTWFEEKTCMMYKFCLKENNKPVGYGGIFNISHTANKGELGYIILEENWGKGYASEAAETIINFCFDELELNKIYAIIDPENIGSKKVVEKFGFEVEGLFKQHEFAQGKYFDLLFYALFRNGKLKS